MRRYELHTYRKAKDSEKPCEQREGCQFAPGLDRDTCVKCGLYWAHRQTEGRIEYHGIRTETLLGV